jgi:hypothetical protein
MNEKLNNSSFKAPGGRGGCAIITMALEEIGRFLKFVYSIEGEE